MGHTNGISVLDLIDAFPADGDPRRFWVGPEDVHPNAQANQLMAARIDEVLRNEHWIGGE